MIWQMYLVIIYICVHLLQLYFSVQMCLKFLDISDNKMTSLRDLSGFHELDTLVAKNNQIDDINDLTLTISTLTSLKDLSLQGNPVTSSYRYRENLIANSVLLGKVTLVYCCVHCSIISLLYKNS